MKMACLNLTFLLPIFVCFAVTTDLGDIIDAEDVTQPVWQSLGGNYQRMGLSKNRGPEIGCIKWEFQTEGPISSSITVGFDNRIHIACEDGKLYTLDPNGLLLWSYDANSPLLSSPSLGPDGTIYVGAANAKLYAVDVNGNPRRTYDTNDPIYSSPAVLSGGNVVKIYAGSQDGTLYALSQDGSEQWSFQTKGPGEVPNGSIFSSPAIGNDDTVYVGGLYDPNLYALDPNSGAIKWKCNFDSGGWPFTSPVVSENGTIYQTLLHDSNLYAVEPNNGTIIWSIDLADPCSNWFDSDLDGFDPDGWSEPALGPDGTIYVSLDDPYLRAIDPNGSIKWVTPLGTVGGFTLSIGNDGLIYAANDDGNLYVVDPNGEEISRFETGAWLSFPVIPADEMIIVSDSKDYSVLITDTNNSVWAIRQGCERGYTPDLLSPEGPAGNYKVGSADFNLAGDIKAEIPRKR